MENPHSDIMTLPKDSGGQHTPFLKDATDAPYGHYLYLPAPYRNDGPEFPLLVFLHGAGERGDSETNPEILKRVLLNGPPEMIRNKKWMPKFPMIVASPQSEEIWDRERIQSFINFLIANYRVNQKRIYLTGISMGGYGAFRYATLGKNALTAAIVPVCGGGNPADAGKIGQLPVWAFHGAADHIVHADNSIKMIAAINKTNPTVKARLTIFPGVKHDSWTMTYDGSGMGRESPEYDAFNMSIYDWMFLYKKEDTV